MWLGPKLTAASEALFKFFFRFLFRYDVFISYARRDGKDYAFKLRDQLRQLDFSCFVDIDELPAGESLNRTLKRALRRSATLVIVGTERAIESRYVQLEVDEFARYGRAIIPIDIEGSLAAAPWQVIRDRDLVWIDEERTALNKHVPSPIVADQIDRLFKYTRRNSRVRAQILATIGIFIVVVAVSLFLIRQQVTVATEASAEAERQKTEAQVQKQEAEIAGQAAQKSAAEAKKQEAAALQNAERARQEQERAEERTRYVQAQQVGVQAGLALDTGEDPERSVLLSVESLRRSLTPEGYEAWVRGTELLPRLIPATRTPGGSEITALAYSPDGRWFAQGANDGTVSLLETAGTGKPVRQWRLASGAAVNVIAFGTDGSWIAAASTLSEEMKGRAGLGVWDLKTFQPVKVMNDLDARLVVFSSDGRYVIVNDGLRTQGRVFATRDWSVVAEVCTKRVNDTLWSAAFSPDSKWLAASCQGEVEIWNTEILANGAGPARKPALIIDAPNLFYSLTFSPGGGAVAASDKYGAVQVWEVDVRDETISLIERLDLKIKGQPRDQSSLTIGEGFLAALSSPQTARVWDLSTGREVSRINHERAVSALAFTADGRTLATSDGHVSFWDANFGSGGARHLAYASPEDKLSALAVSPAGDWLVISNDAGLRMFRMSDWKETNLFRDARSASRLTFSSDGRWFIAGNSEKVTVFDARRPAVQKVIAPFVQSRDGDNDGFEIGFSPDDRHFVVAQGPFLRFFEKDTWRETRTLELNHRLHVSGVSFSPDGRHVAAMVAGENPDAKGDDWVRRSGTYVWDFARGATVACIEFEYFKSHAEKESLCPGTTEDQLTTLTPQIPKWKPPSKFGLSAPVTLDGRWLAEGGGREETAGQWLQRKGLQLSWKQGNAVRRVAHLMARDEINGWVFTPDSRWLVVAANNALTLWPLDTSDMIGAACSLLRRRDLTKDERTLYFAEEKRQSPCAARGAVSPQTR